MSVFMYKYLLFKTIPIKLSLSLSLSLSISLSHTYKNIYEYTRIKFEIESNVSIYNSPGDPGSIAARVIQKSKKMVLDASLLNTQHYKVRIKSKVELSWERSIALLYTSV